MWSIGWSLGVDREVRHRAGSGQLPTLATVLTLTFVCRLSSRQRTFVETIEALKGLPTARLLVFFGATG